MVAPYPISDLTPLKRRSGRRRQFPKTFQQPRGEEVAVFPFEMIARAR
jgi:hypothetical protein